MSLKADTSAMNDAGDGDMGDSVYDCRFWREPKQKIAKMIMNNKKDKQLSVFYFWNTSAVSCQPCTLCVENTLSSCNKVRDTVCITHLEWMKMGIKGNSVLEDHGDDEGIDDEGVIVYKAFTPATKNQEVYGKPVYTEESTMENNSPTRTFHHEYGNNMFGKKTDVSANQKFGKPTFYAKDSHKNRNHQNDERPILAILREVLKNNQSRGVSIKDVLLRDLSDHFANKKMKISHTPTDEGYLRGYPRGYQQEYPWQVNILPNTNNHIHSTSTTRTTTRPSLMTTIKEQDDYDPPYPDSRDNDWPYKTDDKYSLFYYHPQKASNEKDIEDEYTNNQEEDTNRSNTESVYNMKEYGSKPIQADQNLNIPPNLITKPPILSRSLPDTSRSTSLLERILLLVSCIVVLLLTLLLIILSRNTHTSSAFKLLDNSGQESAII